jgi:Zn-dependent protease/Flp pilus assembly protein TadD
MSEALLVALLVSAGWIFSLCFHEYGHAITAYIGGDRTVKERGYLTLNPLAYTNLGLSIILPTVFLFLGGIGLPGAAVLIETQRLRSRYWASLVSAAGPLFSIACIAVLIVLIKSGVLIAQPVLLAAAAWLLQIEIVVTVLNLLPIPGLDGFGIIEPFLPTHVRLKLLQSRNYAFLIVFALLFFVPGVNHLLWSSSDVVMAWFRIPAELADIGHVLYRQGSAPIAVAIVAIAAIYYFVRRNVDWYQRGKKLLSEKKYSECLKLADEVLSKVEEPRALKLKALSAAGLAVSERDQGKSLKLRTDARQAIERAIALKSEDASIWIAKGSVLEKSSHTDEAVGAYERALALDPHAQQAFASLSGIFLSRNQADRLLALSDSRLKLMQDDGVALLYKGLALSELGRHEEGVKALDGAFSRGATLTIARYQKAIMLARLGDEKGALAAASQAQQDKALNAAMYGALLLEWKKHQDALDLSELFLKLKPDDGALLLLKSAALFRMGQYEESLAVSERGIQLGAELGNNWYNKACNHGKLNRLDEAFESLQKALSIEPALVAIARTDSDLGALLKDDRLQKLLMSPPGDGQG